MAHQAQRFREVSTLAALATEAVVHYDDVVEKIDGTLKYQRS